MGFELSPVEQTCYFLSRDKVDRLNHYLKQYDTTYRNILVTLASDWCEPYCGSISQEGIAKYTLDAITFDGFPLFLDKIGKRIFAHYRKVYNDRLTRGMYKVLLDNAVYAAFENVRTSSQPPIASVHVEALKNTLPQQMLKSEIVPYELQVQFNDVLQTFTVVSLSHSKFSVKKTRSLNGKLANIHQATFSHSSLNESIVVNVQSRSTAQDKVVNELSFSFDSVEAALDTVDSDDQNYTTLTSPAYPNAEITQLHKSLQQYSQMTESGRGHIESELDKAHRRFSQLHDVVAMVHKPNTARGEPGLLGAIQTQANQSVISELSQKGLLWICQRTLSALLARYDVREESYYFVAKTEQGKLIARHNRDHDLPQLITLGVQNQTLLIYKVNVAEVDEAICHVLTENWNFAIDASGDSAGINVIYLTKIPIQYDNPLLEQARKNTFSGLEAWRNDQWVSVPCLRTVFDDKRETTRFECGYGGKVHVNWRTKINATVTDFSAGGLCLKLQTLIDGEHIPGLCLSEGSMLSVSVDAIGLKKAKYRVCWLDRSRGLVHLSLDENRKRGGKICAHLNKVIHNNQKFLAPRQKATNDTARYMAYRLISAVYLPHFIFSRETNGVLQCHYRVAGVVDCGISLFQRKDHEVTVKQHWIPKFIRQNNKDMTLDNTEFEWFGIGKQGERYSTPELMACSSPHETQAFLAARSRQTCPDVIEWNQGQLPILKCDSALNLNGDANVVAVYHVTELYRLLLCCQ